MGKKKSLRLIYAAGVCGLALGAIAPAVPVTQAISHPVQSVRADENDNSITIHKFEQPKDEHDHNVDTNLPHNGTEIPGGQLENLKPLEGIGFKISTVKLKPGKDWDDIFTTNNGHRVLKDSAELASIATIGAVDHGTKFTNADGELKFGELADAVYLVEELPDATVTTSADPFLVELPLRTEVNDKYTFEKNVHVYPKNVSEQMPTDKMSKTFDNGSMNKPEIDINNTSISWKLSDIVPESAYQPAANGAPEKFAKSYYFSDPLDARLKFDKNDPSKISGSYIADGVQGQGTPLVAGTDYNVSVEPKRYEAENRVADFVKIELTHEGMKKTAGSRLTFRITTDFVGDWGDVDSNGLYKPIYNTFFTHYDPNGSNPDGPDPETPDKPEAKLGRIDVLKVKDDGDKSALQGAKFKLYEKTSSEFANDNDEEKAVKGSIDPSGKFVPGSEALEITSDEAGKIIVNGLKLDQEYWLVETQAPQGYTPVDPIPVKAQYDVGGMFGKDGKEYQDNQVHSDGFDRVIVDHTDWVNQYLPLTGGQLRLILMVVGSTLVIASGAALYVHKKKENEGLTK